LIWGLQFTCWGDNFGFRCGWVIILKLQSIDFWVTSCDYSCLATSDVWEPCPGCRDESLTQIGPRGSANAVTWDFTWTSWAITLMWFRTQVKWLRELGPCFKVMQLGEFHTLQARKIPEGMRAAPHLLAPLDDCPLLIPLGR
jgi:hypothetical protein